MTPQWEEERAYWRQIADKYDWPLYAWRGYEAAAFIVEGRIVELEAPVARALLSNGWRSRRP
ncbi:MAG: hypothetical protein ACRDHG_04665 [Anaerolineales bacterium]